MSHAAGIHNRRMCVGGYSLGGKQTFTFSFLQFYPLNLSQPLPLILILYCMALLQFLSLKLYLTFKYLNLRQNSLSDPKSHIIFSLSRKRGQVSTRSQQGKERQRKGGEYSKPWVAKKKTSLDVVCHCHIVIVWIHKSQLQALLGKYRSL